ncbi:MAG: 4-(cytidine 5'-diphospho)-2-C-methyl-D-erythritol kinase [Pirellulales bacterium]|nr:4-(cytidine 5'-diphospho)-2-C-methyl-D-erythritol kinase [Pirellulales bacterium]
MDLNYWWVHTPAKINITLEVLGKRADGYHGIRSLMLPIALYDTLRLDIPPRLANENNSQLQLDCYWSEQFFTGRKLDCYDTKTSDSSLPGRESLPTDHHNLVYRAVELLRKKTGFLQDLRLTLCKRIPTQAGLGGGSSDAAAALVLVNQACRLGLDCRTLQEWGAEIGSDVPFFISPEPAVVEGRGEKKVSISGVPRLHWILIKPRVALSTAAVYRRFELMAGEPRATVDFTSAATAALLTGDVCLLGKNMHNDLESAAHVLAAEIGTIKDELRQAGCMTQLMSGSGSSFFGLARSARHARKIAGRLQARGLGQVWALQN